MTIFVGNLHLRTSEEKLKGLFEFYGEVDSLKITLDESSGSSKGFGFVEMPDEDEAEAAIEGLNGAEFDGKTIVVKKAIPREGGGGDSHGGDRGGFPRQPSSRNNEF